MLLINVPLNGQLESYNYKRKEIYLENALGISYAMTIQAYMYTFGP